MSNLSMNQTKRRLIIAVTLVVPMLAIAGLMVVAGTGQVAPPPNTAKLHQVPVRPIQVDPNYLETQLAYGRVESGSESQVGFELSGEVVELWVDEGDYVVEGQKLARLNTARLDAQMNELKAALASAKADLQLANLSQKRVAELVAKKLDSSQRLDEATQALTVAKARADEVSAKIDSLAVELQKSVLVASESGTIIARPIDPGTVVGVGQPVFHIQRTDQLDVRIALPREQAQGLSVGQISQLTVNQQAFDAVIKSISAQRKLDTRTIDVVFRLSVPNNQAILAGDLATYRYQKVVGQSGVWVPKQALTSGIRGLWTLFVVPELGEHPVTSKSVEVLYSEGERAFVSGALSEKDWLVISGTQRLVPGQQVLSFADKVANNGQAD